MFHKIQKSKNPKLWISPFASVLRPDSTFPKFGFLDFWDFGFLDFWIFGTLDFWIFGFLDFWIFGFLEVWIFGFLDFWIFGTLDFWIFGWLRLPTASCGLGVMSARTTVGVMGLNESQTSDLRPQTAHLGPADLGCEVLHFPKLLYMWTREPTYTRNGSVHGDPRVSLCKEMPASPSSRGDGAGQG